MKTIFGLAVDVVKNFEVDYIRVSAVTGPSLATALAIGGALFGCFVGRKRK